MSIKITRKQLLSPAGLFIIYMVAALIAIIAFRFFYPGKLVPLEIYNFSWPVVQGIITYINLFPALMMAALIIPFGIALKIKANENFGSFSAEFFQHIKPSITTAISAVAVYGLLLFLALPLAHSQESRMVSAKYLFFSSKERAEMHFQLGNVFEASRFLDICELIWPNSPLLETLRTKDSTAGWQTASPRALILESGDYDFDNYAVLTNYQVSGPVEASSALRLAEQAFNADRFYEAHWLANLTIRIANVNSSEAAQAHVVARQAWDAIGRLHPEENVIYLMKRSGHDAFMAGDWVTAYFIFIYLSAVVPRDLDVMRFLSLTEENLRNIAFFTDEARFSLGNVFNDAVFSFPRDRNTNNGRMVLHTGSLTMLNNHSFAADIDLMAFDEDGELIFQVTAPYGKLLASTSDRSRTLLMMNALDRYDGTLSLAPVWDSRDYDIIGSNYLELDISYESFAILAKVQGDGITSLFLGELLRLERGIGAYGYIPERFQATIIFRLSETAILLPLSMFVIIVGWRYRVRKLNLYVGIPMLVVMPLVFSGVMFIYRSLLNAVSIWSVINFGFLFTSLLFGISIVALFVFSLVALLWQHGDPDPDPVGL